MRIVLNGQEEELKTPDLMALVLSKGLKPEVVVIEHNGAIVKRADWQTTPLKNKDRIELISFVGGG